MNTNVMNRQAKPETREAKAAAPLPVALPTSTPANTVSKLNPLKCMNQGCAANQRLATRLVERPIPRDPNKVIRTQFDKGTQQVKRVRVCDVCGHEWSTVEVRA